jgi:hypothetical protein
MPITPTNPFKGRQYPGEVILLAVRWYLRYPLAYLHVSEILTGTRPVHRRQLHLALGAGICTRDGQALPSASEDDEQELPR